MNWSMIASLFLGMVIGIAITVIAVAVAQDGEGGGPRGAV